MIKRITAILGAFFVACSPFLIQIGTAIAETETTINSYTFRDVDFAPLYICTNATDFIYNDTARTATYHNSFFSPSMVLPCDFEFVMRTDGKIGLSINGDFDKKYPTAYQNGVLVEDNIYAGIYMYTYERFGQYEDYWYKGSYNPAAYLPTRLNSYYNGRKVVYGSSGDKKKSVVVYDYAVQGDFDFNNVTGLRVYNSIYTQADSFFVHDIWTEQYTTRRVDNVLFNYEILIANTGFVPTNYLCIELQSLDEFDNMRTCQFWLPAAENINIDTYKPLRTGGVYDSQSYTAGYTKGYKDGKDLAYESGFTEGVTQGISGTTPVQFLGTIFQTFHNIFDFEIFGVVKVGTIVFIPVFLSLIFLILRLVRGG